MDTTLWVSKSLVGEGGEGREGVGYVLLARVLHSSVDTILYVFKLGGGRESGRREWVMHYRPESCLPLWILSSGSLSQGEGERE